MCHFLSISTGPRRIRSHRTRHPHRLGREIPSYRIRTRGDHGNVTCFRLYNIGCFRSPALSRRSTDRGNVAGRLRRPLAGVGYVRKLGFDGVVVRARDLTLRWRTTPASPGYHHICVLHLFLMFHYQTIRTTVHDGTSKADRQPARNTGQEHGTVDETVASPTTDDTGRRRGRSRNVPLTPFPALSDGNRVWS
jgi:hypothetical protein